MKTTAKEYNAKQDEKKALSSMAFDARLNEDYNTAQICEADAKRIDEEYFDLLPTVSTSFMIGYRSYFRDVVKIGKSYFTNGQKMTKSRGFYCITEIPEITEKMEKEMLADMYYY